MKVALSGGAAVVAENMAESVGLLLLSRHYTECHRYDERHRFSAAPVPKKARGRLKTVCSNCLIRGLLHVQAMPIQS